MMACTGDMSKEDSSVVFLSIFKGIIDIILKRVLLEAEVVDILQFDGSVCRILISKPISVDCVFFREAHSSHELVVVIVVDGGGLEEVGLPFR